MFASGHEESCLNHHAMRDVVAVVDDSEKRVRAFRVLVARIVPYRSIRRVHDSGKADRLLPRSRTRLIARYGTIRARART